MFERIVLAYDGTSEGRRALREGALLARRHKAKVYLIAVISSSPAVAMAETMHATAMGHQLTHARELLSETLGKLRDIGFEVEAHLIEGDPPLEISAFARQVRADLVVVGHRRQKFMQRWWSGSTGSYLLDNMDCSLLIARNSISDADFAAAMDSESTG